MHATAALWGQRGVVLRQQPGQSLQRRVDAQVLVTVVDLGTTRCAEHPAVPVDARLCLWHRGQQTSRGLRCAQQPPPPGGTVLRGPVEVRQQRPPWSS